jgi:hypothetical protein
MIGPVLIAGSILRFMKSMGASDPNNEAMLTARIIPVPTTHPKTGLVCKYISEVR